MIRTLVCGLVLMFVFAVDASANSAFHVASIICFGMAPVHAADQRPARTGPSAVPLGHPDFYPSRQHPVSWRGDLGGNFVGADPLLTWDGFEGKGLVWKTPMPNWAGCGCIVVGKRVITRASPSTLLCYDADTGKRLWYDKTDVFDYHFKDDPEKAQEMRVLLSKWQRQRGLGWGEQGKGRLRPWTAEERDEWIALTKELVASHPHWFRFGKTGGRKLLEKDEFLARLDEPYPTEIKDIMAVYQQIRVTASPFEFWKLGITENKYNNSEDATISTPCSDGKYVYTANAHNLITCHDIETGKVRWMVWTGMPRAQPVQGNEFWPSPWISGGKLIVYNNYALRAFDPDTGEQLWVDDYYEIAAERGRLPTRGEYAKPKYTSLEYPPFATGHDHAVNCAFLTIGDTPVAVTSIGTVVRISDGKRLARLPDADMNFSGNTWVPYDDQRDIVVIDNGRQTGGNNRKHAGAVAFKLTIDDSGALKHQELWRLKGQFAGLGAVVLDGYLFGSKGIFDIETGELVSPIRLIRGYYQSLVRTRQHVFSMPGNGGGRTAAKRPKLTQNAGARIKGGHLSTDPGRVAAQCFRISLNSLWEGYAHEGADIKEIHHNFIGIFTENPIAPVRTWARQAFEEGVIGWLNAPPVDVGWANNAYGAPPFCVGDRIYFRSRAFLYCLGDEAEAVPGDPVMAETIESSDDPAFLLTQLKSEQAPYRLRAARRLGELKHEPALDALEAVMMVTTESAAVRRAALFSIQATAEDPTRATAAAGRMIGAATAAKKWNNFTVADVVAVFKPLDEAAITSLLRPLLATDVKDDKQRAAVIGTLEQLGCATEPVRQGLLALLHDLVVRKQVRSPSAPAAVQALTTMFFNDPDVNAQVHAAFVVGCGPKEALPYLLAKAEEPGALLLKFVNELPIGYSKNAMLACGRAVAHEPEIPGLYPALRKRIMAGDYCVPRTIGSATNKEKAHALLVEALAADQALKHEAAKALARMPGSKDEVVAYYVAQAKSGEKTAVGPALMALSGIAKSSQEDAIKAELAPLFSKGISTMKDSKWTLVAIANGLNACGKQAQDGLPQLKELKKHTDKDVAAAADEAVQTIEKELSQ